MPVTILLKRSPDAGVDPGELLRQRQLPPDGQRRADEFVPERLRGEVARFDITDKSGKVIVAKDKRVTVRHTRDLETSERPTSACRRTTSSAAWWRATSSTPTPARSSQGQRRADRAAAQSCARPACRTCSIYTTNSTRVRTCRRPCASTRPRTSSPPRRHLPHDAPGEPPTEDAVQACSSACSTTRTPTTVARGRMKFNAKVARNESTGRWC